MDMEQYISSDYITVDAVKSNKNKQMVILSAGSEKEYDGKKKVQFLVEHEGKQKKWVMNKQTIENLIKIYGKDSTAWIGKLIRLKIGLSHNNKEMIIGDGVVSSSINN